MKEQIQQLIAAGQTKDALELLVKMNPDALLLQAQYNNGEKQFNLGLLDFNDWGRIQARVNFAALEMLGKPAPSSTSASGHSESASSAHVQTDKPSVFISYNHEDSIHVDKIEITLKNAGIKVIRDKEDMAGGQPIREFIENRLKEKGIILSVVSNHSLRSGWVGIESDMGYYAGKFGGRQILPVMLDHDFIKNDNFVIDVVDEIDLKIKEIDLNIDKSRERKVKYDHLQSKRNRLQNLRENLSEIVDRLQNVKTIDISGNKYEEGMKIVLKTINGEIPS